MSEFKSHNLNPLQLIIVMVCAVVFLMFTLAEIFQPEFDTPVFVWPIIGGTFGVVMGFSFRPPSNREGP